MKIVCISRGSYDYSQSLAEKLAGKLGCSCISREMITDRATDFGIPVGRLEMAILKNRPISEEMAIEMDLFKAYVTGFLCEKGLSESIVYHGRTGHLVLPSLNHVMRIRTIAEMDARVKRSAERMNISWEKAKEFNEQVDEDIRRWVKRLYNVDWDDPALYDVTMNATHLAAENAATLLMNMAQLPEYTITPASRQGMQDLLLASRVRLTLGMDSRTQDIKLSVQAQKGKVSITYPPHYEERAREIPSIIEKTEGMEALVCTAASTNILYIGERFSSASSEFTHLIEIAEKWNSAVDVAYLTGETITSSGEDYEIRPSLGQHPENGGILDDVSSPVKAISEESGVPQVMDRLIQAGRAGRLHNIGGEPADLPGAFSRVGNYSLVVVGEVFSAKKLSKQRLKRDYLALLADKFKSPVIGTEDLKSQYLFGTRQLISLLVSLAASILLYVAVFMNQEPIVSFLAAGQTGGGTGKRIAATISVMVFSPIVAFVVGSFYKNLLKLMKME